MSPWAAFFGLVATTAAIWYVSALAAAGIAYVLPSKPARFLRTALEWAVGLSGAGYVALFLIWWQWTGSATQTAWHPLYYGVMIAVAHLPLGILLQLRACEPHWSTVSAGRALGQPAWRAIAGVFRQSRLSRYNNGGLFAARVWGDAAAFTLLFTGQYNAFWAWSGVFLAALLFSHYMPRLAQKAVGPVIPPFYTRLPAPPPRLNWRPRLLPSNHLLFHLMLVLVVAAAALIPESRGLLLVRAAAAAEGVDPQAPQLMTALSVAVRNAFPLLAAATVCIGVWLAWKGTATPVHRFPFALAGFSPLLAAYPAVWHLDAPWYAWLPLTIGGLAVFIFMQNAAARQSVALTARSLLTPGENNATSAARALGLPLILPYGAAPFVGQAISSAAAWLGAAALLAAALGHKSEQFAAYALVWAVLAGLLQLVALWIRGSEPQPRLSAPDPDLGLEVGHFEVA